MVISLILFFISLLLMLAAVLSILRARKMEQVAKVHQRLEQVAFLASADNTQRASNSDIMLALERWLSRVGFQIQPGVALALAVFTLFGGILVFKLWGAFAAALWLGVSMTFMVLIPQVRYRQKVEKLISQIPLFIDQVVRGLATGRNVEGAIKLATEDLQEPLRGVVERAHKSVELGADLGEAFREAANFYEARELHMLALAIHTSRVYGGSPRDMLESVVNLIRQREQMQRELRAMTGETRVTAWVLGLMPTAIAGYMLWLNPDYLNAMWAEESGRMLLMASLGFQALGGLILWRMIKSI